MLSKITSTAVCVTSRINAGDGTTRLGVEHCLGHLGFCRLDLLLSCRSARNLASFRRDKLLVQRRAGYRQRGDSTVVMTSILPQCSVKLYPDDLVPGEFIGTCSRYQVSDNTQQLFSVIACLKMLAETKTTDRKTKTIRSRLAERYDKAERRMLATRKQKKSRRKCAALDC